MKLFSAASELEESMVVRLSCVGSVFTMIDPLPAVGLRDGSRDGLDIGFADVATSRFVNGVAGGCVDGVTVGPGTGDNVGSVCPVTHHLLRNQKKVSWLPSDSPLELVRVVDAGPLVRVGEFVGLDVGAIVGLCVGSIEG